MKQMTSMTSKMVLAVLAIVIMVAAAVPAQARTKKQALTLNIEPSIQFIGSDFEASTFRVQFNSEKAVKFELSIRSEEGVLLYSQQFESANFSKHIKFMHDAGDDVKASFTIRDLATGAEQSYQAAPSVTTVKTVNVTKL